MTDTMVREWSALYKDELTDPAPSVQSQNEITENLEERTKQRHSAADVLYRRWLQPLMISNQTGYQDSPE